MKKFNASEQTIFDSARQMADAFARAAYLDQACAGDAGLRERIEALIVASARADDFLAGDPLQLGERRPAAVVPVPSSEGPGAVIGKYKLLEKLGEGGCGVVYMAVQEQPVRRRVAFKIIKLGMDTKQVVARFEAERQALALMDHPHIAKVLDAGATETGRPYFVMELVGGIKITDFCGQNRLETRQRLELFIQVCRAIQHAHQKGIIHRDIKPSNVLVACQDGVAVPKVIDFGIAKATQGRLTDQTVFTAFEQFIGTPAYMSPEQAQLGRVDVDTRSDIYSLGVLLYELLTGRTPFDTREILAGGLDEMRRTICEKEPVRPSTRLTQERLRAASSKSEIQNPESEIDQDLDWIVMKCLEKDRGRRYETANGLARDIERHLDDEPIVARPPSRLYEFQKTVRRHKFGFAATAAVIVALALGVVASTSQALRSRRAEREQSRLRQEAQAARQDATTNLWTALLSEAHALRIGGQAGRQFESLAALRKAAAIRPDLALRNEAIAAMVLTDIRLTARKGYAKPRQMVAGDPTLEHFAVCDRTGAISIRRVSDDRELARLPTVGPSAKAPGVFSPDGKLLAVRYADGHWRIWDWAKPAVALDVGFLRTLAFSPDSTAVGISDGTNLVLRSLTNDRTLKSIPLAGVASLRALGWFKFDPAGQRLALFETEADTNVLILDLRSGQEILTLQNTDHVYTVAWHPDGRHLATGCADQTIHIWDTTSGQELRMWRVADSVRVAFNHGGDLLLSSGWTAGMHLWEFPSCRQLANINDGGDVIGFGPDDRRLVTLAWDGTGLDFFEMGESQGLRTFYEAMERSNSGGGRPFISKNGRLLVYRTQDEVRLWDVETGLQIAATTASDKDKNLIGFNGDEANLILTSKEGLFRWPIPNASAGNPNNPEPAILVSKECANEEGGRSGCVSLNGKVCGIVHNNYCQIFRTDTFAKQAETGIQPGMRFIDISRDGAWVATGAWHLPGVRVWDARTGEQIAELPTDDTGRDTATTVAFSPDGHYLVTAAPDEYCFWEVGTWLLKRRIPAEGSWTRMAFSPDGKIFAGTHSGYKLRLFTTTGEVLADLEAPNCGIITGLAFNHDGTQLAACESQDALRVWDLRRIRRQLAQLGLDWNQPPYPGPESEPASQAEATPRR
jgi:serine/threonine protein kinase/WD40 repeat protein